MTEQKKSDGKKPTRKIKASTGAWWKTIVEDEPEQSASEVSEKSSTAPVVGQADEIDAQVEKLFAKKTARKKSPPKTAVKEEQPAAPIQEEAGKKTKPRSRRSPRAKKAESESAQQLDSATSVEASTQETPATAVAEAEAAEPASQKPARKRAPRKKKPVAEEKQETSQVPVPAKSLALAVVSDSVAVEQPAAGSSKEAEKEGEERQKQAEQPEQGAAGRKRTPRQKRAAKDDDAGEKVVKEAVAAGDTVSDTAPVAVEAQEEAAPVEETVEEKPVRTPRKRAPRKRKTAATEEAVAQPSQAETEAVEADQATDAGEKTAEDAVQDQQEPKRKSSQRRGRGRRGRGRQDKEAVAETEKAATDSAGVETESQQVAEPQRDVVAEPVTEEQGAPELAEDVDRGDLVLKLLINAEEPEECRLALLENGRLESIHVSTINRTQTKNNIYKGKIVAIEPNLQAAFVDYGTEKNGFLPFSEIHPEYYKQELPDNIQQLVDAHHWKKLSITDVVEKGQDVMVQVVKEEVGKKGANMTTYLSLPGRSVVLMPGSDSSGISRKISGEERRGQLRKAMNALEIPEGIGWIVRTASVDITKTALSRDVGYLLRLWEEIKKKAQTLEGVGQVYEDHQSVLRFLREHFDPAIEEILVDDKDAMEQVKEFISMLPSAQRDVKVRMHKGSRPIFNQFSVEDQIESIFQPKVNLPSGGSIVIEPTEALVSIDVNSGSTSKGKNFDQSIYQANLEAAGEIGRQLRLRDLGGLIVVDFIDMRNKKHIRDVERQLKQAMRNDKAKVDFSRISKFGLMQISRQKLGSPIEAGNYRVCTHCKGRGTVRSVETLALFYLRRIQTGASRKHVARVECHFPLDVAQYLLNNKRHEIHEHETRYNTEIAIIADPSMSPIENEIILHKAEKEADGKKQA